MDLKIYFVYLFPLFNFLLWINNFTLFAQSSNPFDVVGYENVRISNLKMGSTANEVLSQIGRPDSILMRNNEFQDVEYECYFYANSQLHITNDKLSGFILTDSTLNLELNQIRIGQDVEKLIELFKNSYPKRSNSNNRTMVKVRIDSSDSYILFTVINNVITRVEIWDDY